MHDFRMKGLFQPTDNPSSFPSIVAWWELRRIAFNVLVGAVGILSLIAYLWLWGTYLEKPGDDGDFTPLLSVFAFGTAANFFYTSGWLVEGIYLTVRKRGSQNIGPRLFKLGLSFSLVLASLPGFLGVIEVILKKFSHEH
jgi:hypothetical protein